jgi:hypothetical protein
MKDCYDFSKAVKNPYAENIKKNGFTVTINYNPKDLSEMKTESCTPSPDEMAAFEEYRANMKAQ